MRINLLITLMILPTSAFAQDTTSEDALKILNQAHRQLKTLAGTDESCFACQFSMSAESAKEGQGKLCDDLFSASCLGPDGKSKYQGRSKSLPQELQKAINEARDKTSSVLGFKDFDDALKAKFKEAGLELLDNLDPEAWRNLKKEGGTFSTGYDVAKRIYKTVEHCDQEAKDLQTIEPYTMTDVAQLRDAAKKCETFISKYRELSVGLYTKDISTFFNNEIASKCSSLNSSPSYYKPAENPEVATACGNINQLKNQALELFRIEGNPGYQEQAEKFVRENSLPALIYSNPSSPASTSTSTTPPPAPSEMDQFRSKVLNLRSATQNYCYTYSNVVENAGNSVFVETTAEINKSKTTVDAIIESFYGDDKKKIATQIFHKARADIQEVVSQFVKDPSKRDKILNGYDRLKLLWMEKPPESDYKKDKKGTLVLDEDKSAPSEVRMLSQSGDAFTVFSDPSLSFFTTLNADYMPSVSMGNIDFAERVKMMPAFIQQLDKNPYSFLSVIAHEAGHKIGPEVSRINGYDLTPEYQELIACYRDSKSIGMKTQQADETIADYISSEVLAREIAKLPTEKRRQALISSMEDFCIFDDAASASYSSYFSGAHPESSLRASGVYGASPNLRKAIGCEGESSKFKSCGLKDCLPATASEASNKGSIQ